MSKRRTHRSLHVAIVLIATAVLLAAALTTTVFATGTPGMTDTFSFGVTSEENSHNLTTSGTSSTGTITADVGEWHNTYNVRYMEAKDSEINFNMAIDGTLPLTLEIEEIHNRSANTLGYDVFVEGTKVYFRSYEEESSGPNHYFVKVPASLTNGKSSIAVKFKNVGAGRVNFGRIWAYVDFDGLMTEENAYRKMVVSLWEVPKLTELTYTDYDADIARINYAKNLIGTYNMYDIDWSFDIGYMNLSIEESRQRLDWLLNLAVDTGIRLKLSLNSWWVATPFGPDGLGGLWTDVKYQQVVYEPKDGIYKLSIPNAWGNTTWRTMNDVHYNQVRNQKMEALCAYTSEKIALMRSQGRNVPPVSFYLENEPVYWPDFAFTASYNSAGDFGTAIVQAASADGVTLNPADGLSINEKEWMHSNMNKYAKDIADAMASGFGRNAVQVSNGTVALPDYQLKENTYTHMFVIPTYPLRDSKKHVWEAHAVNNARYGAEFSGVDNETTPYDYIAAHGKFATVNVFSDYQLNNTLISMFQKGADFTNIFFGSSFPGVAWSDISLDTPVDTVTYERILYDLDFEDESDPYGTGIEVEPPITGTSNMMRSSVGGHMAIHPSSLSNYGEINFHFTDGGQPFDTGLSILVDGRALTYANSNCKIEVYAGSTPDNLTLQETLTDMIESRIDLSSVTLNQTDLYLRLRLYTGTLTSWTAINNLKVCRLWPAASGHTNGDRYTIKQVRTRNLWLGYRGDTERLLQEYLAMGSQDSVYNNALSLYNSGRYVSAYNALISGISQLLPAKYSVYGFGTLGSHPFEVSLPDSPYTALVQLDSYNSNTLADFTIYSEAAQNAQITWNNLTNGLWYKIVSVGGSDSTLIGTNRYNIVKTSQGDTGAVQVSNNKVSFNVSLNARAANTLPSSLSGKFIRYGTTDNLMYIVCNDVNIQGYSDFTKIPVDSSAIIKRGAEGANTSEMLAVPITALRNGDRVDLTIDSQGNLTACNAYYGHEIGTIQSVEQVTVTGTPSNGSITLTNGHKYVFTNERGLNSDSTFSSDVGFTGIDVPGKFQGSPFLSPIGGVTLSSGDIVEVDYIPYSYNGTDKRAMRIYQAYDNVLSDDYQTDKDSVWTAKAEEYSNLAVVRIDQNYPDRGLTPINISQPGYVIYKVDSNSDNFDRVLINYSGRGIINANNGIEIYGGTSADSCTEKLGELKSESDFKTVRTLDISSYAAGKSVIYVKFIINSTGYSTWGFLNSVKISRNSQAVEKLNEDYEVADDSQWQTRTGSNVTVYDYGNLTAGPLDTLYPPMGLYPVNMAQAGYVTYKVDSMNHGGFKELVLDFAARGIYGATVKVYTGTDPYNISNLKATVQNDNGWDTLKHLNLTSAAMNKNTVYVRFELKTNTCQSWAYLGSVKFTEYPSNYTRIKKLNEDYEVADDSQWQTRAGSNVAVYSYGNLTAGPLGVGYPKMGLYPVNMSQTGNVTYKVGSQNKGGFRDLVLDFTARGIYGATVKIYSGTDPNNVNNLLATIQNDSDWDGDRRLDLTNAALNCATIYIRFELTTNTSQSWAYLGSVSFVENTYDDPFGRNYVEITRLSDSYETFIDEEWQTRTASGVTVQGFNNLTAEVLDTNYPYKGLYPVNMGQSGYITYKLDTMNLSGGFQKLWLTYTARGIYGATVKIYTGTNPNNINNLVATVQNDGGWNQNRVLDLKDVVQGQNTIYVKFELSTNTCQSWAYLGSISFVEGINLFNP